MAKVNQSISDTFASRSKKVKWTPSLIGVFDKVNATCFSGMVCAGIQWKELRLTEDKDILGLTDYNTRIINVAKILQHPDVPAWVIEAVIIHECIHLLYTSVNAFYDGHEGKDMHHSYRFACIESKFPILEKLQKWEEDHLPDIVEEYKSEKAKKKRLTK